MDEGQEIQEDKYTIAQAIEKYRWFFCSLLREILNTNCHPLYKKRNINVRILVDEIVNYLKSEQVLITENQIKDLVSEFLYYNKIDPVFKRYGRNSQMLIKKVQEINENKERSKNRLELIKLFEILKHELDETYINTLQGLLNSFLKVEFFNKDNLDFSKKINIFENLIFILISELKIKYTEKYLKYFFKNKFNLNINFEDSYNDFLSALLAKERLFSCYVKFKISCPAYIQKMLREDKVERALSSFALFLLPKKEVQSVFDKLDGKHKEDGKDFMEKPGYFVKIDLKGHDIYKVTEIAKEKLINKLDILLYQDNYLLYDIIDQILVEGENLENAFVVNIKRDINFNIDQARKNISNKFFSVSDNQDRNIKDDSLIKIQDSLKYYRFYLYEDNVDSALLNLWIALESLFSSDKKDCNFDLIKSIVPTVTSLYFLRETFDELQLYILDRIKLENDKGISYGTYFNLKRYIEDNNLYNKRTDAGTYQVKQFNNVGLLRVLSDLNKKNCFIDQINDPYYSNKYNTLSNKVLIEVNNFKNLKNFLNLNYFITQWEIYRIYRIRNSLVHGGRSLNLAIDAIYFLEYYYILLLDDILDKFNSNDFKRVYSLEEYFDRIKRSYDYYNSLTSEKLNEDKYKFFVLPYFVL